MIEVGNLKKAGLFKALHERDRIFVLPNPWDMGTAKILAALGFEALATTSAGYAFSRGHIDWVGEISRDDALAHSREIVDATPLALVHPSLEPRWGPCSTLLLKFATAALLRHSRRPRRSPKSKS